MGCGSSTAASAPAANTAEPAAADEDAAERDVDEPEDPLDALKDRIDEVIGSDDLAAVEAVLSEASKVDKAALGTQLTLLVSYHKKLSAKAAAAAAKPEPEPCLLSSAGCSWAPWRLRPLQS